MKKYELMVIIKPDLDEKAASEHFTKTLSKQLKDFGGEISWEDFWGSRGFAYMIKKYKWGYYGLFQFEMDPTKASELRHELNLDKNVLRFLLTLVDKNAPEPRKYTDMKKEYEAVEKKIKEESEVKEAPRREKLNTIPKKTEEKPVKKDELDKKLDAVIDDASVGL